MHANDLPIVCFCVVFHGSKVLILKRSHREFSYPNTWWLPGGHVEMGETLEQGVIREVYEETDIRLDPRFTTLVKEDTSKGSKPLYLFVSRTDTSFVALKDGEHSDYLWIDPSDVLQYTCNQLLHNYVQEALMFQSSHYGLQTVQAPGSVYAEAAISPSMGAVKRFGMQGNPQAQSHASFSAPIVYKKNCATCKGSGYGGDCGCGPKAPSPYGQLYVGKFPEPVVYGNPAMDWWNSQSTAMKVAYPLAVLAVIAGGVYLLPKIMK